MTGRPSDKTQEEDGYLLSYESVQTTQVHADRTAEINAAFFLPYLKSGMSLLDCGCGSGSITLGLAERVAPTEVIGIDIGESEIEAARERSKERGLSNARFEVANAYELPFPESSFDAVFSHNMAEHLNEPVSAFKEMLRVLKPGGLVGVRDIDIKGVLMSGPSAEIFSKVLDVLAEASKNVGGDLTIGRWLKPLLREAGFSRVLGLASYETFPTQEAVKQRMEITATLFEEGNFLDRVISNGISDEESMARFATTLRAIGNRPDSYLAVAHGEVIGWKD